MKIVINSCYGGFSLSPLAIAEIAKRKGRKCYFFKHDYKADSYIPITMNEASKDMMFTAFDVPNPSELVIRRDAWHVMSLDERIRNNDIYRQHVHDSRPGDRSDHDLVAVVEKLGSDANGSCADLRVVEIPDGVDWELDEYDGVESVHEKHRSWS